MIKKVLFGIVLAALTVALIVGAVQRTSAKAGDELLSKGGQGQGGGRGGWNSTWQDSARQPSANPPAPVAQAPTPAPHVDPAAVTPGSLSADEIAGLVFMSEEEKLARDVYLAMYELWGQPTFKNIANSEQTHMDAVLELIEGYGEAAPVAAQGTFNNPDLQKLYDQLVAQGSQSIGDALKVGAAIEEIDILDLRERSAQTDEEAIRTVYASLESGSENHLRAFTSTLARRTGEAYQPQYLSAADYQSITGTTAATNGRRGGR